MPIYEYECENCGAVEEVLQKFSDDPITTCKHCSGKLHKIISQTTFQLKGTGWYVTDYAKGSSSSCASSKPKAKESSASEKQSNDSSNSSSASQTGA